jgi:collagen triple helix repeat protein
LIAGGSNNSPPFASAELFDPGSDPVSGTFTALANSMTTQRISAGAAVLPDGDVLIAGGGTNSSDALSSAEVFAPAAEASLAGGAFGDQTLNAPSTAEPVTVLNVGSQLLDIAGATVTGTNESDFTISDDGCAGLALAFEQSCTISVVFTPSLSSAESATLALQDNEAVAGSVSLTGTGVALPAGATGSTGSTGVAGGSGPVGVTGAVGPVGATGPPGPRGPSGPTGPSGPAGATGAAGSAGATGPQGARGVTTVIICTTPKVGRTTCRTERTSLSSAPAIASVRLVRDGRVLAVGRVRAGRVVLSASRRLAVGRYRLVVTGRVRGRIVTMRGWVWL